MNQKAYEVTFCCKTPDCDGIVVESEWMTKEEAYAHLRNHRKLQLECEKCNKTYEYAPAIDGASVRPWPIQTPKRRARVIA